MSADQLAQALGMNVTVVDAIEAGEMALKPSDLLRMSSFLNVSLGWFYADHGFAEGELCMPSPQSDMAMFV